MHRIIYNKMLQLAAIVALLFVAIPLRAQTATGAITGRVTDPAGNIVPGAMVTVTDEGTGVTQALTTDSEGFYSAENLPVGQFTVSISKAGFKVSITKGIQLNPGQRRAADITLEIGSVSAQVMVNATTEQVNTETSESSGTVSSKQIDNLMLNGRNFTTLALAVPGVSSTSAADSVNTGNQASSITLDVNGMSAQYTYITIDGIYDMNTGGLGILNIYPAVDGISEFTILKNNYSAKYGFSGSGQVVVETKGGTDTYHGTAWEYLRNNSFDANNYFSTATQPLHENIFGYALGGPLIIPKLYNIDRSKKTFFFALNQWQRINAGLVERGSVFPQALRTGAFATSPTLSGTLALDANSKALLASEGKTNCITGPTTLTPTCFDPVAVALMNAYFPLPNNPSGGFLNYINQNSQVTDQLDYQYRVDHEINQRNELTVRSMYQTVTNAFPYDSRGGSILSTIKNRFNVDSFNGLVRVASTITPTLINTAGVAYTDDKVQITPQGGTMPSGVSIVQAFPNAPNQNLIPNISISKGWTGTNLGNEPIIASDGEGISSDDISWVKGNHVLQVGAEYWFGIKRQNVATTPEGSFTFTGVHTGDPAADYLLGLDSSYSQASSQRLGFYHYRQGEIYLQDDWRATPRLSLNFGIRWVYFSNDTVSGDQVTNFNPALYNPEQAPVVNQNGTLRVNSSNEPVTVTGQVANSLNGLVFAGQNGVPSGFFVPIKTNFGPRVGFAYDVFGDGKTSIRGGYGIGYMRLALQSIYAAFGQNPPYNLSSNVLNSLLSNGTAGTSAAPTTQTLDVIPFKFTPAQIQSYSLTIEHQLETNMVAAVAYAGSQGRHLNGSGDINFPLAVASPSASGCANSGPGNSGFYDFDPCINTGTSSANYTRPYQGYSTILNELYDGGSSNYNSLQSQVTYRSRKASQFSVADTYSKALGTVTTLQSGAQNPRNFHAEYGPPSYNFTNNITGTWVYNIPYFDHDSKAISFAFGNWSFAGLALHQSGFAYSPSLTTKTAGQATRPNQVAPYHKIGTLNEWFDTSSFAAPNYGFFGNASNGSIRGPSYTALNMSLYKTFPITERLATQIRAEAFNVANHPNFEAVDTGLGDASFGQVTSAFNQRILEFALKVIY